MVDMFSPLGGVGSSSFFSPNVGSLSFNTPSFNAFSSLSLGASNFAMANPAMSLISQGYGTGRSNYSLFGSGAMFTPMGIGAPMFGGGFFFGPGPMSFDPMAMFWSMYNNTFGQHPTQAGGPANAPAPQPAPPAAEGAAAPDKKAEAEAPAAAAPAGKAKGKGGGRKAPSVLTPKIAAEFQGLLKKYKEAGEDLGKMKPKDAKRIQALVKQYPSLQPKADSEGGAKRPAAEPATPAAPDPAAVKARKLARLQELETKMYNHTATPAEEIEVKKLQADPDLR